MKYLLVSVQIILLMGMAALGYLFWDNNMRLGKVERQLSTGTRQVVEVRSEEGGEPVVYVDNSDIDQKIEDLRAYVDESVAAIASQPAESTTTTIVQNVGTPSTQKQTTYIPLDGTQTTTDTDWVTIEESAAYIDVENDYDPDAYVSWSASLKVAHANGKAYARLYDATNNIAVVGSELSTENNSAFEQMTSGRLYLWRGRNLYKVQIKSLNSFEITMSGGKIRVSY